MDAEVDSPTFKDIDEGEHDFGVDVLTHGHDDLLNNVVAIEIEAAVFDLVFSQELKQHFFLLVGWEYFEARLHHSAAMHVRGIFEDSSSDVAAHHIHVLNI